MTGSNDQAASTGHGSAERRTRLHLRDVFERAYVIAYPLLDSNRDHLETGSHFLRVVLHDAFPELHQQDIAILSVSIETVFRTRNKPASS